MFSQNNFPNLFFLSRSWCCLCCVTWSRWICFFYSTFDQSWLYHDEKMSPQYLPSWHSNTSRSNIRNKKKYRWIFVYETLKVLIVSRIQFWERSLMVNLNTWSIIFLWSLKRFVLEIFLKSYFHLNVLNLSLTLNSISKQQRLSNDDINNWFNLLRPAKII